MANANGTASSARTEIIGSYSVFSGVQISIEKGTAVDYASMLAGQLSALLQTRTLARDCEHSIVGEDTEINSHWLACNLADELEHLIKIVDADAQDKALRLKGGAK
jgi:hypothetical protein